VNVAVAVRACDPAAESETDTSHWAVWLDPALTVPGDASLPSATVTAPDPDSSDGSTDSAATSVASSIRTLAV